MKFFGAIALFFSAQAFACPNLAGTFTCQQNDGVSSAMTITQSEQNGVTTYVIGGSPVIADNASHPIPDAPTIRNAKPDVARSCSGLAHFDPRSGQRV